MSRNSPENKEKSRRFPDGFRILQGKQEFITYIANSSIRIWPYEAACSYDLHFHSAVEIVLVMEGEVTYTLSDTSFTVSTGQVLILPPNCTHAMAHEDGTRRYLFLFEPQIFSSLRDLSMMTEQMSAPVYLTDESELHKDVRALLLQAAEIYDQRQPMWNSLCYSLLIRLYAMLGKSWIEEGLTLEPAVGTIDSEIMNSVLSFISQHYTDDLRLDDAAAFSGFSKYYFSRAFKKYFHMTFTEYLCRCRLEAAMDLLTHTRLPIRRIAEQSGFGSIATFNRVFRAAHACTPSRYRTLYGGQ